MARGAPKIPPKVKAEPRKVKAEPAAPRQARAGKPVKAEQAPKTEKTRRSPVKVESGHGSTTSSSSSSSSRSTGYTIGTSEGGFPPPPMEFKRAKAEPKQPYPDMARPAEEEVLLVTWLLGKLHGVPAWGLQDVPVLDSVVRTILSQNTTDKTSRIAFLGLKAAFGSWRAVHDAYGTGRVEEAIKVGGLSEIKARNVHNILAYLLHAHLERCPGGEPSYEWLREESTEFVKAELLQHKGVGAKTVRCVSVSV